MTKKKKIILTVAATLMLLLTVWTVWGNTALTVSEFTVVSAKLPLSFSGFRIAQISDLHNAEFGDGNKKLMQMLEKTEPDIIVITGDIVDSNRTDADDGAYTVLLSHRPELFDAYVNCSVDLVFSGHAHGGQFRLPFIGGIVAPGQGFFPKYDSGAYTKNGTTMIVSRGIGNSIIPIRFNNRPEIVIVELIRE